MFQKIFYVRADAFDDSWIVGNGDRFYSTYEDTYKFKEELEILLNNANPIQRNAIEERLLDIDNKLLYNRDITLQVQTGKLYGTSFEYQPDTKILIRALEQIRDMDFRGNRSQESVIAFNALEAFKNKEK